MEEVRIINYLKTNLPLLSPGHREVNKNREINVAPVPGTLNLREKAMAELQYFLSDYQAVAMFAYNAAFDYRHLPELRHLDWYDIMKLAAYRQHNPSIPDGAECCRTGRLKRGYGVESVYRMLSAEREYCELHNALTDAIDELTIMKLLNHEMDKYALARI